MVNEPSVFELLRFDCIGMAAILFNHAELFEPIDNTPSTEGPVCNLVKIGQADV